MSTFRRPSMVLNLIRRAFQSFLMLDSSLKSSSFAQAEATNLEYEKLAAMKKGYVTETRAVFETLAKSDPALDGMIRSLEMTLLKLEEDDLALNVLFVFHAEGDLESLGSRLEAMIVAGREDLSFPAIATLRRYCSEYLGKLRLLKTPMTRRLAQYCMDATKSDNIRVEAYRLLCTLQGSQLQNANSALAVFAPADFDTALVEANL